MASGSSSGSLWKVATGARMVAAAFLKQSSEETGVAAQRIAHHGADLSSKAQKTVTESGVPQALWTALSSSIPDPNRYHHGGDSMHSPATTNMTVRSGTAPYESQLRKKRQRPLREASMGKFEGEGVALENDEIPNPYLFHQPAAVPSSSSSLSSTKATHIHHRVPSNSEGPSMAEENSTPHQTSPVDSGSDSDSVNGSDTLTAPFAAITDTGTIQAPPGTAEDDPTTTTRLREGQAVPSSRFGRAFGFATLGAGLAWGAVGEITSRVVRAGSSESGGGNVVTTDANADRLAATLCRMRGAALKMGQMLSIQDESLLPPALTRALKQVRQGADAMPNYQLVEQLRSELGGGSSDDADWRNRFASFDDRPFAAASIGQVHRATIVDEETGEIRPVVVKVQYPGVARSIESDLGNLAMLVRMTGLAPRGLFIDNVMRVGRDELKVECNYLNEMANQETFQTLVHSNPVLRANKFVVPDVIEDLTTELVITTGYAPGGTIDKVSHLDQEERNRIGRTILYLTMQELFEWRLMQTDPNWGNFLYDVGTGNTTLIDFGATREFPKPFVDGYLRIVWASANRDEETLMRQSLDMGFLTGEENDIMLNAHKLSGFTVGEPFWNDEPFDFRGSNISTRMGEHTSVFLRHRLTPPPEEVYTLHRKLAGAYMLCIKLGAVIRSRDMLEAVVRNHVFEDGMPNPVTGK
mmetsp:Transcript_14956/g.41637  ORF Transcript_14956/g.41637 Transcript_14956/m.41637 type:complete len:697 (+) Transcript_14956:197-2287(+)